MTTKEIATLMYISGDVKTPKLKSLQMMENILRDQMNLLLLKAEENAYKRETIYFNRIISHGDVLFIIRNNKIKLKRLLVHLNDMDMKCDSNASKDHLYTMKLNPKQRYLKMCVDFLATIEDCGEFSSLFQDESILDISLKKRQMRQHWRMNTMTPSEQEEFLKISKEISRPVPKFKEWLMKDEVTDFDLTDCALSIIEFLARETIAEIIDMVLLMKMKRLGKNQYSHCEYYADLVQVDSEWKADMCDTPNEGNDLSQPGPSNIFLNEASNEAHSDSVPIFIDESSKDIPSIHSQGTRHTTDVLSDVSDDYNRSIPDTEASDSRNRNIEIFDLSDTDLFDSLQDNICTKTISHNVRRAKLKCGLSDTSDVSDLERKRNNCKKKASRRRCRSNGHPEVKICHFPEELYTFDTSTATNHLSTSAKNEADFISPTEPNEIADAFARFQEPSPLVLIFNCGTVPRETKLICLADSLSVDFL